MEKSLPPVKEPYFRWFKYIAADTYRARSPDNKKANGIKEIDSEY